MAILPIDPAIMQGLILTLVFAGGGTDMSPAIHPNDFLLITPAHQDGFECADLQKGDIIAFTNSYDTTDGSTGVDSYNVIIHRVQEVKMVGNGTDSGYDRIIITKGDNAQSPDLQNGLDKVDCSEYIGKVFPISQETHTLKASSETQ